MPEPIILASSSEIRSQMLSSAGVIHDCKPARIDEDSIKAALLAEGATSRDIADTLAEMKARKIGHSAPDALVLGCDQVLAHKSEILSKPVSLSEAADQLRRLRGETHQLLSALVIYHDGEPIWRHVGVARLTMPDFSDAFLDDSLDRHWDRLHWSVGGYTNDEEDLRLLFDIGVERITIMGVPLLPLLSYLTLRGTLPS